MEIHDTSEHVTWNITPPEFYIQDILPKQGVMLVYGNPKVKKSWLVQHMAFNISIGEEWLGFRTEQARCLLCNFEISPIAYAWRLKYMARNYQLQGQMLYDTSPMLMYLDEQENYNRFRAAIREYNPQVIILDCLAACFGGDENDSGQVARWIERMNELKSDNNSSLVIVHHTNKNMLSTSSVDRARGHSRLAGWVDTLLYLAEQPNGVQLQFKARQATHELGNINAQFAGYNWSVRGQGE